MLSHAHCELDVLPTELPTHVRRAILEQRTVQCHQITQRFASATAAGSPKACAHWGTLASVPFTRKFVGGCGSVVAHMHACSGRTFSPQKRDKLRQHCCSGV